MAQTVVLIDVFGVISLQEMSDFLVRHSIAGIYINETDLHIAAEPNNYVRISASEHTAVALEDLESNPDVPPALKADLSPQLTAFWIVFINRKLADQVLTTILTGCSPGSRLWLDDGHGKFISELEVRAALALGRRWAWGASPP